MSRARAGRPLGPVDAAHHASRNRLRPLSLAVQLACATGLGGTLLTGSAAFAQTAPAASETEKTLPVVHVSATAENGEPQAYAGGQVAKGARIGALGNRDVMETPFNVTSYTSEFIENQQARTVAEVLLSDPSVRFTTSSGHMYENFRVRGFDVNASELAINGVFGLAPIGHVPTEFLERVELLKGPSAVYSGMAPGGGVGGVINLVPKRAIDAPVTSATLGYASDSQLGASVDVGRRFGERQAFGVRVNGSFADGDTDLDGQSKKREFVSAALDYRGTHLTASLDAYHSKESYEGGTPAMFQFQAALTTIPSAPDPSVNQFRGLYGTLESNAAILRAEYEFNHYLTAFASAGVMNHDYSGFINGTHARQIAANGNYTAWATGQLGYNDNATSEGGLRANFATGSVGHQLVLQASWLNMEAGSGVAAGPTYSSNIYNPVNPVIGAVPTRAGKNSETTLSSFALVDTLSFLDERLLVTLGLRDQRVRTANFNSTTGVKTSNYDESALTPAFAVVVRPWGPSVSLYANYVQGLSQGGTVTDTTATNYGEVFKPYKTDQTELGAKWDLGTFTNTVSVYQLQKPALVKIGNTYTDDGEQRNRGVEWNTFGEIVPGVRLLGGVSYTQGTQTKTANHLYDGKTAIGTPHWQANIGPEWDLPWLPGLTVSGRVTSTSEQYLNASNTQTIPGWTLLDLGARYTAKVYERKVVTRFNVNNVFDKHYWSGSFSDNFATLGSGRSFAASATVDF